MNQAVRTTCERIKKLLGESHAFREVDSRFFVVRQGSAYVYLMVLPWGEERALIRMVAQLARGVDMTPDLALKLLHINATLRFGSFGWVREGSCVTLQHSLLGGSKLDDAELLAALRDIAMIADEYDDRIVNEAGGRTMQELLHERELAAMRDSLVNEIPWESAHSGPYRAEAEVSDPKKKR